MEHHTKLKGDIGLTQVIADLTSKNYNVFTPISEHLPYDLIVTNQEHKTFKIQVKYRTKDKGSLLIDIRSTYVNTFNTVSKLLDYTLIDILAVYCPNNNKCYYIPSTQLKNIKSSITLRIDKPANNNVQNIRFAEDYLEVEYKESERFKKCPYCDKKFNSWESVRKHTSRCNDNNKEYTVDLVEGPIHIDKFNNRSKEDIRKEFPKLQLDLNEVKKVFARKGIQIDYLK